jgi:hypothetical protein
MARYDYPVYVVVPIGDAEENATDEDVATLTELVSRTGVVAHAVIDPDVCDSVTQHLLDRLGTL